MRTKMAPQDTSQEAGQEAGQKAGQEAAVAGEASPASDVTADTRFLAPTALPVPPNDRTRPVTPIPSEQDPDTAHLVVDGGGGVLGGGPAQCQCQCLARSPDVDGGWAWVVLAAAFLQFFITSALYYSFSVFFVELVAAFRESRGRTGWVYSTNSAVHMFSGPVGGWCLSRWGLRVTLNLGGVLAAMGYLGSAFSPSLSYIFFFYGVVNAVGTSLTFSGWVVGLGRFWERRHALAMGVAMAGSGCGVLLLGPQLQVLVTHYGWRGAMVVCAGLYLHLCIFAATLYSTQRAPPPCRALLHCVERKAAALLNEERPGAAVEAEVRVEMEVEEEQVSTRHLLCSPAFCLLAGSCFLSAMATTTVFAVLRDWAELTGLGAAFSSALAGSGAGDLLGRVLAGLLVGRGCPSMLFFSSVQLLLAATIGFAATASISTQLVAAMVGFGVACGLHSVIHALIPSQLTSGVGVGHILGCLLFVTGIGALVGPPVVGAMVDFSHSYGGAMMLCTAAPATASVLNVVAYCCFRRRSHHTCARAGAAT